MKKKPDKYLILLEFAHWYYDKYKDGSLIADIEEFIEADKFDKNGVRKETILE